jgi:triacylglycerol lipase
MYGIYKDLRKNGWTNIYPINLFPNINDIREQARIIAKKVEQIKNEQKVSKIDYVAHSMGGLIGRYYIQELNGYKNINNYISIATPHYGTYTAFAGLGEAAKQMRPGSEFLNKLNSGEIIKPGVNYTSIWTKLDEIVIPAESALLQGSNMKTDIKYVGHFFILWSDETYKQIRETLGVL